jgi:hypothetical protein
MVAVHVEEPVLARLPGRVAGGAGGNGLPAQGVGLAADGGGVGGDGREPHVGRSAIGAVMIVDGLALAAWNASKVTLHF